MVWRGLRLWLRVVCRYRSRSRMLTTVFSCSSYQSTMDFTDRHGFNLRLYPSDYSKRRPTCLSKRPTENRKAPDTLSVRCSDFRPRIRQQGSGWMRQLSRSAPSLAHSWAGSSSRFASGPDPSTRIEATRIRLRGIRSRFDHPDGLPLSAQSAPSAVKISAIRRQSPLT